MRIPVCVVDLRVLDECVHDKGYEVYRMARWFLAHA